jgi:nucleotide-binding universal stress UspA family protein
MRFENILFPVDFSESSVALKADVEWIAKQFGSTVTAMYVFEIPPAWHGLGDPDALNAGCLAGILYEAKRKLDAFAMDLPADKVKRVLLKGQPAAEIREWCNTHSVDLIAMATHGHDALEGLMMRSVTAKVLHNVNAPLWLRPEDAGNPPVHGSFRIVCGIDLGTETQPVLLYARDLAAAFKAQVTLVHSVAGQEPRPDKYPDFDLHQRMRGVAEREIATFQKEAGTTFDVIVTDHGISGALAIAADETKANLILIGRGHARKFLGRFRTHTYDLLCQVRCPVFCYCRAETSTGEPPELNYAAG